MLRINELANLLVATLRNSSKARTGHAVDFNEKCKKTINDFWIIRHRGKEGMIEC